MKYSYKLQIKKIADGSWRCHDSSRIGRHGRGLWPMEAVPLRDILEDIVRPTAPVEPPVLSNPFPALSQNLFLGKADLVSSSRFTSLCGVPTSQTQKNLTGSE